jgi:hypothetical protein
MRTVYALVCKPTRRVYIGMSCDYKRRVADHFSQLKHHKHKNPDLQADYIEYGRKSFSHEPLTYSEYWIQAHNDEAQIAIACMKSLPVYNRNYCSVEILSRYGILRRDLFEADRFERLHQEQSRIKKASHWTNRGKKQ